jgi:hypothetical protein
MSFPEDAGGTFEGRLGCPSELVLDGWAAGELSPRSSDELKAHLAGCDVCQRRMDVRRSGFSSVSSGSLASIDTKAMLARIRAGVVAAPVSAPPAPSPAPAVPAPAPGSMPAAPTTAASSPLFDRRNAWLLLVPVCALLGALAVRWLLHR